MNNDELVQRHGVRLYSLETRLSRIEAQLDQLLSILSSSNSEYDRHAHIQAILQELRSSRDSQMGSAAGFAPTGYPQQMGAGAPGAYPQQERPEVIAIREAVRGGDKIKAIKLYRSLYGVGLEEAKAAVDAM